MIALVILSVATYAFAAESQNYCLKNENLELFHGNNEISKDAKCYIACIYNCSAVVSENGELDIQNIITSTDSVYFDKNEIQKINETLHNCVAQAQKIKNDPCEYGYQSAMCLETPVNLFAKKFLTLQGLNPIHDAIIKSSKESGLYFSLLVTYIASGENKKCSHRLM